MAKAAATQDAVGGGGIKLSLTDFCKRLSETVKRPELIGAFFFVEERDGNFVDDEAAFRKRFDAFRKTPV